VCSTTLASVIAGTAMLSCWPSPVRPAARPPTRATTRRAAPPAGLRLLADGSVQVHGPFISSPSCHGTTEQLQIVTTAVQQTPGVAFVSPARERPTNPTARCGTCPTTSPRDQRTTDLVGHLRNDVLPTATAGTDVDVVLVATQVDFSSYLAGACRTSSSPCSACRSSAAGGLPLAARPVKAVIMNLLSIGAAYGVVVAIFQWGWLSGIAGIEAAPIEPFLR
jgi:RND superfamily putative drug exporter